MSASAKQVSPLQNVERAFYVGRRRHIDELPPFKRFIVRLLFVYVGRLVYFLLRIPVPDINGLWTEGQGIYTSEVEADRCLKSENWLCMELPVNQCLSEGTAQFGKHWFGGKQKLYDKREMDYLQIPRKQVSRDIQGLSEAVKSLKNTASEL